MLHVKKYAHPDFLSEDDILSLNAVKSVSRLAITAREQVEAAKGHPALRNSPLNRKERRTIKNRLDKARGRNFTKSSKEGRNKRHAT